MFRIKRCKICTLHSLNNKLFPHILLFSTIFYPGNAGYTQLVYLYIYIGLVWIWKQWAMFVCVQY